MLPAKIRKPSEWRTIKSTEVRAAVKEAKKESSIWSDVSGGWSFSPKDIGGLGPQTKRRRLFTGTIYPSDFLANAAMSKRQKIVMAGIGLFVAFDIVMICLLVNYLM